MAEDPDDDFTKKDHEEVVGKMLSDLGVDDEMKKDLFDSGRMSSDVLKVASAEQVRRQQDLEKSTERLSDSIHLVERNFTQVENTVDRIERDILPVVLSFLVGLKGDLVGLKGTVIGRSKRRAKTNLQATYVDTEVKAIVEEEFEKVEQTLTEQMSGPVLEKLRDVTDGLNESLKLTLGEITNLKAILDDYLQRSITEVEFLTKELGLKPRVEVPKEVEDKMKQQSRQIEELKQNLELTTQKLENRETEIATLQSNISSIKSRNESLEETVESLRSAPTADAGEVAELRQNVRALEASKDLLSKKLVESETNLTTSDLKLKEVRDDLSKKELELADQKQKTKQLEDERTKDSERLAETDELRARLRSYETGENVRELTRVTAELERATASLDRISKDFESTKAKLIFTEMKLESYMDLMDSAEKTKAFLMVEEHKEMPMKAIARSIGVGEAVVRQWAEDFVRMGIVKIEGDAMILDKLIFDE
ncbi:MAG: hypothetical protein ACW99V_09380 [Candidatus Thorarchaeota archaeon]|jgi:chromosome segregation ATPase